MAEIDLCTRYKVEVSITMTEKEYKLAKRFIKRNWENMDAQEQLQIAQRIGGIRHYVAFMEGMRFWLENDCEFRIDRDYCPMYFEPEGGILPLPLAEASKIRGARYNTIILDDAVNIHSFSDEDVEKALKKVKDHGSELE